MKKISAEIVADSVSPQGHRITSYILTYPRFIHSELMTHRLFSRNAASSRAIPFEKMCKMVEEDPFIPIAWQKNHKGMQGTEYFTDPNTLRVLKAGWMSGADAAIATAKALNLVGATKQVINRLVEPYQWYTVLVTATEYDNFFELRCPKYKLMDYDGHNVIFKSKNDALRYFEGQGDEIEEYSELDWIKLSESGAEIHIQALAEAMWDARNESTPKKLEAGEWHIPFSEQMDETELFKVSNKITKEERPDLYPDSTLGKQETAIRIATARCARLSYLTFDGEIDYEKDIKLHDQLLESRHASPFEHCSRALTNEEYDNCGKMVPLEDGTIKFEKGWVDNFRGFKSYRRILNFS